MNLIMRIMHLANESDLPDPGRICYLFHYNATIRSRDWFFLFAENRKERCNKGVLLVEPRRLTERTFFKYFRLILGTRPILHLTLTMHLNRIVRYVSFSFPFDLFRFFPLSISVRSLINDKPHSSCNFSFLHFFFFIRYLISTILKDLSSYYYR